jgi:hypothetical protein
MTNILMFPTQCDSGQIGPNSGREPTAEEVQEVIEGINKLQSDLLAMRNQLLSTRSRLDMTRTEVGKLVRSEDISSRTITKGQNGS